MLYEMIAARQPFVGTTMAGMLQDILSREPDSLEDITWRKRPREFQRIVFRALRKDREERYQTVQDLLNDLKDLKSELEGRAERSPTKPGVDISRNSCYADPEKSIAVLYFENMNAEDDSDYFLRRHDRGHHHRPL